MDAHHQTKPHAVFIPFPAQGHINPIFMLAKLLHSKGFHITFVHSEYNHCRLLKSEGPSAVDGLPDFRFHIIPDGLPPPDPEDEWGTQYIPALCESTMKTCLPHFRDLLSRLKEAAGDQVPPVSCIISDGAMTFTLDAAEEFGVPEFIFWTASSCAYLAYRHFKDAIEKELLPPRDEASKVANGYLDIPVDWIPGMPCIRFGDLPSFIRMTSPDDPFMVEFAIHETDRASSSRASGIILNTFEELERPVLDAMASIFSPPMYTIGPLSLLCEELVSPKAPIASVGSSLWKEDKHCLGWLDGRRPGTVVYVNFGSITVMSNQHLVEFAWGLAGSGQDFLWAIRPDLVRGDSAVLPEEFLLETQGRGLMVSWCPQEAVLRHPAVGGFLNHNGWNSTLESICCGVPMLCWPFFADQPTNCRYACAEWGVGMEIDSNVRKEEVSALVSDLMTGDGGNEMRKKALAWKQSAESAVKPGGSSALNLDKLVAKMLPSTSNWRV